MDDVRREITVTVSGPAASGKSAVASIIAKALFDNGVPIAGIDPNESEDWIFTQIFEHPPERAKIILKQISADVKLVVKLIEQDPEKTSELA